MTAVRSRPQRGVDPRIQARRASVARSEGFRRLWVVVGLTLVASLAIGAIAATKSSWLDVESVEITGTDRADPRQVGTAAGIEVGEPLVEIDVNASTEAVERVPWVAEAVIDREWAGAVSIAITERVGMVAFSAGSRYAVVDRTGRQLELVMVPPEGFIPVSGVEASGVPGQPVTDEAMAVVSLIGALSPALITVTDEIVVSDGQLMMELTVGGRANLGDVRDLGDKLVALETILARVDLRCLAAVDIRVPEAPTVRRKGSTAPGEEPLPKPDGC